MENTDDKNPADSYGSTPLHDAAQYGHLDIVRFIVEIVDDKNPRDNDGKTPLDFARQYGHLEVVRLMENS